MSGENQQLIRRLIDAFDRRDFDTLNELLAEDFVWHGGSFGEVTGRQAFMEVATTFYTAFSPRLDLHEAISQGDLVATRFTWAGTHNAEFLGIPATGEQMTMTEQPIYRVANGVVAEEWWVADIFGLMRQIGAIPSGEPIGDDAA
jgi:steroid delta-isomerase-like uncharacterized protein